MKKNSWLFHLEQNGLTEYINIHHICRAISTKDGYILRMSNGDVINVISPAETHAIADAIHGKEIEEDPGRS